MKKIYIISLLSVIVLMITLIIVFIPREKNNLAKVSVAEVTHSVFYAPLYVALEKGYFEEEGLDVELILASGADKVSAAVLSNDVQIGFAGAESAIYVYEKGEKDYMQIFCGLTKRDGQFIIGREKNSNFSLNDLEGKEILVGRKSGMPALNFLNALKNEGINPELININYSVDFAALSGSFLAGTGDFVNLFEPNALKIEKESLGFVVESIGKLSGEMPYTAFYARKSFINNNPQTIKSFVKAIDKGLKYVHENDESSIAKIILKQFPDTSENDMKLLVKRYKDSDSWLRTNYISEKLLQNLEDIMINNDLLDKYVPYEDLVVNINYEQ